MKTTNQNKASKTGTAKPAQIGKSNSNLKAFSPATRREKGEVVTAEPDND